MQPVIGTMKKLMRKETARLLLCICDLAENSKDISEFTGDSNIIKRQNEGCDFRLNPATD